MEQRNEPGPAQGEMKIQDEVSKSYMDILESEKAAQKKSAEETKRNVEDFNKFKGMGFATPEDVRVLVEQKTSLIAELQKENQELKKEFTALKEFLLRAKARSQLNAGVLDDNGKTDEDDAIKALEKYRRFGAS